jgi:hypothetical protein
LVKEFQELQVEEELVPHRFLQSLQSLQELQWLCLLGVLDWECQLALQ